MPENAKNIYKGTTPPTFETVSWIYDFKAFFKNKTTPVKNLPACRYFKFFKKDNQVLLFAKENYEDDWKGIEKNGVEEPIIFVKDCDVLLSGNLNRISPEKLDEI